MKSSEVKFKNTADKLGTALIALLENKEFNEIGITDICKKAGVNRSTFYSHYDNIYGLLEETYNGTIHNFLKECIFDNPVDISDMNNLSAEDLNFVAPKYLLPYLNYVKKHERLFKIYIDNIAAFDTEEIEHSLTERLFIPIYAKYGITDENQIAYMQSFFLRGMNAIVHRWVKNGCKDDVSKIYDIIALCIRPKTASD